MRHLFECLNCASQRATNCQRRVGALAHGTKSICLSECQKGLLIAFSAERFQISCLFHAFSDPLSKKTLMGIVCAEPTLITRSAHKPGGAITLIVTSLINEQMRQSTSTSLLRGRRRPTKSQSQSQSQSALPASDSIRPRALTSLSPMRGGPAMGTVDTVSH